MAASADPRVTRDDKGMIESPDLWPVWPHLPMKNPTKRGPSNWPAEGFFLNLSTDDDTVVFYEGCPWQKLEKAVKTELTVDEVLAAGWVVD